MLHKLSTVCHNAKIPLVHTSLDEGELGLKRFVQMCRLLLNHHFSPILNHDATIIGINGNTHEIIGRRIRSIVVHDIADASRFCAGKLDVIDVAITTSSNNIWLQS